MPWKTRSWVSRCHIESQQGNSLGGAGPSSHLYLDGNNSILSESHGKNWKQMLQSSPVLTGELYAVLRYYRVNPSYHAVTVKGKLPDSQPVTYWARGETAGFDFSWKVSAASIVSRADSAAVAAVLNAYDDAMSDIKVGPIVGELGDTLSFLNSVRRRGFNALIRPLRNYPRAVRRWIKRRRGYRLNDFLRWSSNYWLEWRFALLPLLRDLDDIATAFNKKAPSFEKEYVICKGSGFSEEAYTGPVSLYGGANRKYVAGYKEKASATVKYRGATVSTGTGPALARYGLNLEEAIPTAWELLPYSWLVDYATNTGDVIRGWSYRSVFGVGLQRTEAVIREGKRIGVRDVSEQYISSSLIFQGSVLRAGYFERYEKTISRSVVGSLRVPDFAFQIPGAPSAQDLRWVNVAALLVPKLIRRAQEANSFAIRSARGSGR